jgi:hypothetical protein
MIGGIDPFDVCGWRDVGVNFTDGSRDENTKTVQTLTPICNVRSHHLLLRRASSNVVIGQPSASLLFTFCLSSHVRRQRKNKVSENYGAHLLQMMMVRPFNGLSCCPGLKWWPS